ncbi:MAG: 2-hydroxychromene-2-carboxylate isomerase [Gammaproteobacteria bacterium]|jgi:2-hydroxychromene-2-carboxylate isomerase
MAPVTVDYYLSLNSPWTYLGHERFMAIAAKAGVTLRIRPVDFSLIFPKTGGLPVPQRPPQRQAYRMQELKRWRAFLDIPLNLQPAHWPANDTTATGLVIAAREAGLDAARLAGAYMRAVWAQERDIGDEATALAIATEQQIDAAALLPQVEHCLEMRVADSLAAMNERNVFGAPSYVIGDEVFWGQDRLEFVARALS